MCEPAALRSMVVLAALLGCSLVASELQAEPIGSGGSRAPMELTTRGMLLQRWDRNRDGKIDLGEAEMARVQMRRERMERAEQSRIDPITGRKSDELFSSDDEDGGDFFRRRSEPKPGTTTPAAQAAMNQPLRGDAPAGTTADATSPTPTLLGPPSGLPSTGGRSAEGAPLSSAARVLPQQTGRSVATGSNTPTTLGGSRPFERPTSPYGPAITGGIRAGAPAVRPGYGTSGTTSDLNAGRLLGGPPLTGGRSLQGGTQPGAPPSGGSVYRGGSSPRPGSSPPEF